MRCHPLQFKKTTKQLQDLPSYSGNKDFLKNKDSFTEPPQTQQCFSHRRLQINSVLVKDVSSQVFGGLNVQKSNIEQPSMHPTTLSQINPYRLTENLKRKNKLRTTTYTCRHCAQQTPSIPRTSNGIITLTSPQ